MTGQARGAASGRRNRPGRGGLEYEDVKVGEGSVARRGCSVDVRYDLFLNRGEWVQQNQVCSFRLGERRVVAGLEYCRGHACRRRAPHPGRRASGLPRPGSPGRRTPERRARVPGHVAGRSFGRNARRCAVAGNGHYRVWPTRCPGAMENLFAAIGLEIPLPPAQPYIAPGTQHPCNPNGTL